MVNMINETVRDCINKKSNCKFLHNLKFVHLR